MMTTWHHGRGSYGSIQVSGPAIAASRDSAGAFVQALESEIDGLQRDTATR